jgi:hypothetical protein
MTISERIRIVEHQRRAARRAELAEARQQAVDRAYRQGITGDSAFAPAPLVGDVVKLVLFAAAALIFITRYLPWLLETAAR